MNEIKKFAMLGALGRMGKTIALLSQKNQTARLMLAIERDGHPQLQKNIAHELGLEHEVVLTSINQNDFMMSLKEVDAIVDFSSPTASLEILEKASRANKPIVIGTTGWSEQQKNQVKSYAKSIPVLLSSNMSIGVNALFALTQAAAKILLKKGYNPEITEIHHNKKKDAPSGTAKTLEAILLEAAGWSSQNSIYGRQGMLGERPFDELGVMSLRGGDVTGEHTVYFFGEGERVELKHLATSRDIFAQGALLALDFICKQEAGLYSMQDVMKKELSI